MGFLVQSWRSEIYEDLGQSLVEDLETMVWRSWRNIRVLMIGSCGVGQILYKRFLHLVQVRVRRFCGDTGTILSKRSLHGAACMTAMLLGGSCIKILCKILSSSNRSCYYDLAACGFPLGVLAWRSWTRSFTYLWEDLVGIREKSSKRSLDWDLEDALHWCLYYESSSGMLKGSSCIKILWGPLYILQKVLLWRSFEILLDVLVWGSGTRSWWVDIALLLLPKQAPAAAVTIMSTQPDLVLFHSYCCLYLLTSYAPHCLGSLAGVIVKAPKINCKVKYFWTPCLWLWGR